MVPFESQQAEVTAVETVWFALDGIDYEVDLESHRATSLRWTLEPYIKAGRRVSDVFPMPSHDQSE